MNLIRINLAQQLRQNLFNLLVHDLTEKRQAISYGPLQSRSKTEAARVDRSRTCFDALWLQGTFG